MSLWTTRRLLLKSGVRMVLGLSAISLSETVLHNKTMASSPSPSDEPITSNVELKSVRGVDYSRLQQLLAQGKWKEADQETTDKMLQAMGINSWRDFSGSQAIENFPCEDLHTIDQLWVEYSNGKFGFSVQKNIWLEVGGKIDRDTENEFLNRVGWGKGNDLLNYSRFTFDLSLAPIGHLPFLWGGVCGHWGLFGWGEPIGCGVGLSILARAKNCSI